MRHSYLVDGTASSANDQEEDSITWTRQQAANTRLSQHITCNSMEVVSLRPLLTFGRPGLHHVAKSSYGSCCREGSELPIVLS
jgi:hypothetical protein